MVGPFLQLHYRRIAVLILFALASGLSAEELATKIPRLEVPEAKRLQDPRNWKFRSKSGSAKRVGGKVQIKINPKGWVHCVLNVTRGEEEMKHARYFIEAEAVSMNGPSYLLMYLKGRLNRQGVQLEAGKSANLVGKFNTEKRFPGQHNQRLVIELRNTGEHQLIVNKVSITRLPLYGVHVRYKVLEPRKGKYNLGIFTIRRHRDTGHRDPIRHRFHSAAYGLAGKEGVKAGEFSEWIDLRRYLFGSRASTVKLHVYSKKKNKSPPEKLKAKVLVQVATHTSGGKKAENYKEKDVEDMVDDIGENLDLDDNEEEKPVVSAQPFFSHTFETKDGGMTFMMPEENVMPDRFIPTFYSIEQAVEKQIRQLKKDLPPINRSSRPWIPVMTNLMLTERMVSWKVIESELKLLSAIGVHNAHGGGHRIETLYQKLRDKAGQKYHFNRWYRSRISVKEFYSLSPYDKEKFKAYMDNYEKTRRQWYEQENTPDRPILVGELLDEPGNHGLYKVDQPAFRDYLKSKEFEPKELGFKSWEDVVSYGYREAPPPIEIAVADNILNSNEVSFDEKVDEDITLDATPDILIKSHQGDKTPLRDRKLKERKLIYHSRVFGTIKTSEVFKEATRRLNKIDPKMITHVNYRSGIRPMLGNQTADWFLMGREKSVTMMWNEDWINTYGWRKNGVQSVSYYTELMRAAARKHNLPVGNFMILIDKHGDLKSYSSMAHGSRYLHTWRYGPRYANYLPYSWSGGKNVYHMARICRDLNQIDESLYHAKREKAQVALLYGKSDGLWGDSQSEHLYMYFALLHAQIPVDIVHEAEVEEDDILKNYKFLMVGDVSLRAKTLKAMEGWVRGGGHVYLSGRAASKDEYYSDNDTFTRITGSKALAENREALMSLKGEGDKVKVSMNSTLSNKGKAQYELNDGTPLMTRVTHGKGEIISLAMRVGLFYAGTVVRPRAKLQYGWKLGRRDLITKPLLDSDCGRTVVSDTSCIEAIRYYHADEDLILLMNYTGKPLDKPLQLQIKCPSKILKIHSLRTGPVAFKKKNDTLHLSLKLNRTDTLRLQKARVALK